MPQYSFLQTTDAIWLALPLFFLLTIVYVGAHKFRIYQVRLKPDLEKSDLTAINGMLLGLLGLMLAFSFSMANDRFNARRSLIVNEADIIGTTVIRTDILPDSIRAILRSGLKQYVEERIMFYEVGMDLEQAAKHYMRADSISYGVWLAVAAYARQDNVAVRTSEIVPSLNAMIDITTQRRAAGEATLPPSIIYFLFILCICAAFLLGYDQKGPINWVAVISFSVMLSATIFTIIDLDRPRSGLINLDISHARMVDLRALF